MADGDGHTIADWPSVTIVFLVYNRNDELRESLGRMLRESDYHPDRVDVIVVDNGSSDGSADMVRAEFPQVQLIARDRNGGVSAINDGFALARGDYVLALDDDCYLPPDGLRRAVAAAQEYDADLVSFKVVNANDPGFEFTEAYRTGLFTYFGCAVLIREQVLEVLGGYDPEIFVFANELEFMLRFFDRGFRHLHFPDVVAQHMKPRPGPPSPDGFYFLDEKLYRINNRHWAYIAGKLLRPRDAAEAFIALLARNLRDGMRSQRAAFKAIPETVRGFVRGLRHRAPVRNAEVSRVYRRNFESFASPWWLSRSPLDLARMLPREILREGLPERTSRGLGRRERYFQERARFYPDRPETLQF